jgi:hypothetical protein
MSTQINNMLIKGNLRFVRLPLFQLIEIYVTYFDSVFLDLIIQYAIDMHGIIYFQLWLAFHCYNFNIIWNMEVFRKY